ncbi:hypothetical protein ACIFOE_07795 [Paenibacillus sp. NRS-1783]|uniref:hypothetical protein n=1 Tax=Paenibacillus sp. NRS-1783 TaxID=3233907 RepID=UPI003D28DEAC
MNQSTRITKLITKALNAVGSAIGVTYTQYTSSELRRVMLELAEEGACDSQYEGCGYFNFGLVDNVHIDEMSDAFIAKNLIRNYK